LRSATSAGRLAAIGAIVIAVFVIVYLLFLGGGGYTVKARFQNAGQIVKGNEVQIGGVLAGSIKSINITDDGQAEIEMSVDDRYAPLREGTRASVRQTSQSGIANRYIQLDLGPAQAKKIPDGGVIRQTDTVSAIDVDQLFNLLNKRTRTSLQRFLKGSADQFRGVGKQANRTFAYLNPLLASFNRVFTELNRDSPNFERFLTSSERLVTSLAERDRDLAGLVQNTSQALGATGRRRRELQSSIEQLPDFMRQADTTFANLRGTLNDLDPLVNSSKPVAPRLSRFLRQLRPFAQDAEPTIKRLSTIVSRSGPHNDLIDLNKLQVPLTKIAVGPVDRNGKSRPGALPVSTSALRGSIKPLSFFRPYTPELVGWFDDFGKSGLMDANGGFGHIAALFNAFTPVLGPPAQLGALIPTSQRAQLFGQLAKTGQVKRCPGALERDTGEGTIPFTDGGSIDCDPTQIPPGP
jgi:phospholipid/cholesterol/gamma-HCH transport system substrate-binding protein